jgi:hypothetical protein
MHARARDGRFEQPTLYGIVVNNEDCLRHMESAPCGAAMVARNR